MNFKGYIALPLEATAKRILHKNNINNVSISSDEIECGEFVSTMLFLLVLENKRDTLEFQQKCAPLLGKSGNHISYDDANKLYCEFVSIIEE